MSELVTIASGLDLQTACLARTELEGSGIYCFLANEALMRTPLFFRLLQAAWICA